MTVRIGYALAMGAATGAPVRVADQLMDRRSAHVRRLSVTWLTYAAAVQARSECLSRPVAPASRLA